jgi:hypothetical protein
VNAPENYRKLQKITENYRKLQKITENYRTLQKITDIEKVTVTESISR